MSTSGSTRARAARLPTEPLDASELAIRVSAIVRELAVSGLTADQIADNNRPRPAYVRTLLREDESPNG